MNPYASLVEKRTIAWLEERGLVENEQHAKLLRDTDIGGYGGYAVPMASLEACLEFTQFISLWLLWDDVEIEVFVEQRSFNIDDWGRLMAGAHPIKGRSKFASAWWDLVQRVARKRSPIWLRRLSEGMADWLVASQEETRRANDFAQTGSLPGFDEVLDLRERTIGMLPAIYLLEHVEGFELPDEVHDHAAMFELKKLAVIITALGNDLYSMAKDLDNKWPTPLSVLIHQYGGDMEMAVKTVVDMHNSAVRQFDEGARALPSFGSEQDVLVSKWIRAVRYLCRGFAVWESRAPRYQKKVIFRGKVLDVHV